MPTEKENDPEIDALVKDFFLANESAVKGFISKREPKIVGRYPLYGLDPMNTVKWCDYLHCKHFIAYLDPGGPKFLQRESVAKIDDDFNILEIYY